MVRESDAWRRWRRDPRKRRRASDPCSPAAIARRAVTLASGLAPETEGKDVRHDTKLAYLV